MTAISDEDGAGRQWRIDTWFPDLSPETRRSLRSFEETMIQFNKSINLISAKSIVHGDLVHFADCILATKIVLNDSPEMKEIYDVGSGNGFPGIVLAILAPQVKVILVESDQRKAEFLKSASASLGLNNVSVIADRIESLKGEPVSFAICRGFASLTKSLMSTRKVMPLGGKFYHMKGSNWSVEIAEIPTQLCSSWMPSVVKEYTLPIGEFKLSVIKTLRI